MATVKVNEKKDLGKLLDQVSSKFKKQALDEAATKASNVVIKAARKYVPVGDPSHEPGKKPLRDTIMHLNRKYYDGERVVSFVGPGYPAGAHGHLVEDGHKVYRRGPKGESARGKKLKPFSGSAKVPGKKFMLKAAYTTRGAQDAAVIRTIQKYIKLGGG